MFKKNILIVVVLNFIIIYSCKKINDNTNESNISKFKNNFISQPFEFFDSEVYKEENFFGVITPSAIYARGYSAIFFKQTLEKIEFDSIKVNLENKSIYIGNFSDYESYFVPNYKTINNSNSIPIPDIDNPVFSFKKNIDIDNSKIIIFKNKKGQYFNDTGIRAVKKLADIDESFILGKGYSNGAIVDNTSNIIIYWVMVW